MSPPQHLSWKETGGGGAGGSQSCSQPGEGEEGQDIKGWAGQVPPPQPGGLCQDRPDTIWTMRCRVFTSQPTGVTAEPRHSMLHDKGGGGGTYRGGQAARPGRKLGLCPVPSPAFEEGDQRGLGAKQQPPSHLPAVPESPPPGSRVQGAPQRSKVGTPCTDLTKEGSYSAPAMAWLSAPKSKRGLSLAPLPWQ